MVKDHTDSERGNPVPPHGLLFLINSKGSFICILCVCVCIYIYIYITGPDGARCSSVVKAIAHGAMGRRIDPLWGGPIELFLVPASAPRLA